MQMRAMGPSAGWRWLMQGINLGRNNPKALFGAAALLLVLALIPTGLQLLVQNVFKITNPSVLIGLLVFSLVYSLLVMSPLIGGFLRVIDAVENGRPTQAMAVLEPFKSVQDAGRMIMLALLLLLIVYAVLGVIIALFGQGLVQWYMEVLAATAQGAGTTPQMPALPDGFGTVFALMMLVGLFLQGVYAVAFGQVALTRRSVGGALVDGLTGALKNLLPLLLLLLFTVVLMIVVALVFALVMFLLIALGGLVHPTLGLVFAMPLGVALLMVIYVVMFGVMYHLWRDVAGGNAPASSGNIVAV